MVKLKVLVTQSCLTLCDPMYCSPPGSSVHGIFSGKNTGEGCHSLLQGIFLTQRLNPGLLHCRQIRYRLSHWMEKEMATHSSILIWKIPWTEEPGRLQSMCCKELDRTKHTHVAIGTSINLKIKNSWD